MTALGRIFDMSKEINCTVCRKPMGEIRDASLRKGLRYICEPCDLKRSSLMVELMKLKNKKPDMPDFLRDIFG